MIREGSKSIPKQGVKMRIRTFFKKKATRWRQIAREEL